MSMAASRSRPDPFADEVAPEALRRRGAEAIGLALLALGILAALLLWSYDPNDPSPFNATPADPANLLGHAGAAVAGALVFALGLAAWGLPAAAFAWGMRLLLHRGEERVLTRLLVAILAILAGAAFLASHAPGPGWVHGYGLGGTLGDSLLKTLLTALPMAPVAALGLVTPAMAPAVLLLAALGLGMNWGEAAALFRFCAIGFVALLRAFWRLLRFLAAFVWAGLGLGLRSGARAIAARHAAAERRRGDVPPAGARMPGPAEPPLRGDDERLMARIAAAVKARSQAAGPERGHAAEPPLRRPAGPVVGPLPRGPEIAEEDLPRLGPATGGTGTAAGPVVIGEQVPPPPPRSVVQHRVPKAPPSRQAQAEAQPSLPLGDETREPYDAPALSLLASPREIVRTQVSDEALEENARLLESVLEDYGVRGEITAVRPGPVVTLYELEPAPGLKASRVIGLADDIARSMSALSARIATVPGRSVIGIELPNQTREKVLLREILSSRAFGDSTHALPLALGKDIGGEPVVANLARMPHLLIAGTTGSGKSVAINTMILSLLYRLSPAECRLIMIDPKMLELSVYDGIPHLLSPVVTDPKKAIVALRWVVSEMEERYRRMSKLGVRNIDGYNARVADAIARGEAFTRTIQTGFDEDTGEPVLEQEEFAPEPMPYIVVIVDEMADLMLVAGKEIEACIQRLSQMARASGIHLIMATQRPSVDVITGTIKANFPTRISFQVTSKIDSRTILGEQGAEQLLGQGDMLYMAGGGRITRIHGPFCSDEEVEAVVAHLKLHGAPDYVSGVVEEPDEDDGAMDLALGLGGNTGSEEALYDQAVAIVARDRKCSTSYIQRKLGIGYQRAARLVEQMEEEGVVTRANAVGKRDVLVAER
jgi:S-DNA-T family DNA segregation ATPase FtsK/SpoIIIE